MTNEDYKPRFGFEITFEQKERADHILNVHGQRKALFSVILDDVLDLIEECGDIVIGIMTSGSCRPREILPSLKKAEQLAKKIGE